MWTHHGRFILVSATYLALMSKINIEISSGSRNLLGPYVLVKYQIDHEPTAHRIYSYTYYIWVICITQLKYFK